MTSTKPSIDQALTEIRSGADAARTVSDWTRFLASEQAQSGGELARAATALDAPQWGSVVREVFSDLYGSPMDTATATDPAAKADWVRAAVERVVRTPEFAGLRSTTAGDEWAAGLGTAALSDAMGDVLRDLAPKTDERAAQAAVDTLQDMLDNVAPGGDADDADLATVMALERALADAQADLVQAQQDSEAAAAALAGKAGLAMRWAVAKAATATTNEIRVVRDGMAGLGAGSGAGTLTRVAAPPAAVRAALRRNPKLAAVAALAGRFRMEARKRQETRAAQAREEVCSVETGADLARLLPCELANLADETTELLLFRKLTERGAMQYELRGREPQARGPLILLLDESGSMSGDRDTWAKAAALALMEVAAVQRRPFQVLHFADHVGRCDTFKPGHPVTLAQIEATVCTFMDGGTNIGWALGAAYRKITEATKAGGAMGKADVVLLTDGADHNPRADVLAMMKADGIGLYVVALMARIPADLRAAAQDVVEIDGASMNTPAALAPVLGMA